MILTLLFTGPSPRFFWDITLSFQIWKMSEAQPTIKCPTCGHVLLYQPVNSPKNKGRWLAQCHFYNPDTGVLCKTFRWLAASRRPSPTQPQPPPALLGNTPGVLGTPTPAPVPSASRVKCPVMGCNSSRINKLCSNRMCKDHCKKSSKGCVAPAHKVFEPPNTAFPAGSQPLPLPRPFPLTGPSLVVNLDPALHQPTDPTPVPTPVILQQLQGSASTGANPVYASHMTDIYTTQIALEEKMREDGRQIEAMRLASKRKVQHTVFVYAWIQNDSPPNLFEIQEGFVWPHFTLSEAVLAVAGFENLSPTTRFNMYRFNLGLWTTVPINHVVELKDGPRVFIKPIHITSCLDFDKVLVSSSSSNNPPNIRTNLAGERDFVKRKMVALELSQSPFTLPDKGKRKAPSFPFVTPTRKRHHPTTPVTSQRDQVSDDDDSECDIISIRRQPRDPTIVAKRVGSSTSSAATRVIPSQRKTKPAEEGMGSAGPGPSSCSSTAVPSTDPLTPSSSSEAFSSSPSSSSSTPKKRVPLDRNLMPLPFLVLHNTGKLRWPADFFAVDVVECFEACEAAGEDPFRNPVIFDSYFGKWVSFVRSTFYEHLARWKSATPNARDSVLSAGRTPAGLWSVFMATTPAPRARIKAERKRKAWVDKNVVTIPSDEE